MKTSTLLLATLLLAGATMDASSAAGQTSAPPPAPSADEQAVRGVVSAYETAWNRHDMAEFGRLFTEDAEWVNIVGMWWRGRADVQKAHQAFHEVMFRDVPLHFTDVAVRTVAPGVAVAIGTIQMGDYTTPGGHTVRDTRDRMTLVMVQRDGRWKIVSGHNTVIDPVAARHDPVNRP